MQAGPTEKYYYVYNCASSKYTHPYYSMHSNYCNNNKISEVVRLMDMFIIESSFHRLGWFLLLLLELLSLVGYTGTGSDARCANSSRYGQASYVINANI